ncbi:MAG TPA: PAS domain-containing protein, partial [Sedimentisphaerales bacterium]|nr:PAS domain-containing protein [Sedimentisphaerales bacterium]
MRGQRSMISTAAAVAVASLMTAVVMDLRYAVASSEWRATLSRLVVYCAGAVGVIFLGIGYARMAGAITSMAARLRSGSFLEGDRDSLPTLRGLVQALDERLAESNRAVRQFQTELKDLEIRSQLSERERRHTEAILYSLRDAVIVIDGSDRLLMANSPAAQLFGFDPENVRHRPLAEVIAGEQAEFLELLVQCRRNRTEATRRELEISQGDRTRTYETIVSCVQTDGKVSGVVAGLHDVT